MIVKNLKRSLFLIGASITAFFNLYTSLSFPGSLGIECNYDKSFVPPTLDLPRNINVLKHNNSHNEEYYKSLNKVEKIEANNKEEQSSEQQKLEHEQQNQEETDTLNSQKWLIGPRFSNIQTIPENVAVSLIFGLDSNVHNLARTLLRSGGTENKNWNENELEQNMGQHQDLILEQSICPKHSNFFKWNPNDENNQISKVVGFSFVSRLMYLVLHEHQHRPARSEALARLDRNRDKSIDKRLKQNTFDQGQTGNFDYECDKDTKYIISAIPNGRGFGANYRRYSVEPLLLGLVTDRVTLTMDSLGVGPMEFRKEFLYANCDRHDMQCMFMPLSPCVLTYEDVVKAVRLPKPALMDLKKTGKLSPEYEKEKVLIVTTDNMIMNIKGMVDIFVDKIGKLTMDMGDAPITGHFSNANNANGLIGDGNDVSATDTTKFKKYNPWNVNKDTLKEIRKFLKIELNTYVPWMVGALYGLRPNPYLRKNLDKMVKDSFPADFDPKSAIGLPIRAGDKCIKEQKCMSFDNYMRLAKEMAIKRTMMESKRLDAIASSSSSNPILYDTIILSSESTDMTEPRHNYKQNETFPFKRFIVNNDDVQQGGGGLKHYAEKDNVMISTMQALHMQLFPNTLVANHCSNFHKLMQGFYASCGRTEEGGHFEWLKKNDNKEFRMQCKA